MRAIRFGLALAIFDHDVEEDAGERRSRAGGHENGDGVEWEGVRCGWNSTRVPKRVRAILARHDEG